MGSFAPIFLAFLLNRYGIHIFREPSAPCNGPLLSFCIFLISVFVLLWDMRLYPKSLRKLWKCGYLFLEFLIADFIMEHLVSDFWFPLEAAVLVSLFWLGQYLEEAENIPHYAAVYETLKSKPMALAASYCLSCFFLIAVLHATRAIDLRLAEMGPACFFKAILFRLKRGVKKIMSPFKKRKVDIAGCSIDELCDDLLSPYGEFASDKDKRVSNEKETNNDYNYKRESRHYGDHEYKQAPSTSSSASRRRGRKKQN